MRDAANGWYPLLAWQLAMNICIANGHSGTVGELIAKIEALAKRMAEEIEKVQENAA